MPDKKRVSLPSPTQSRRSSSKSSDDGTSSAFRRRDTPATGLLRGSKTTKQPVNALDVAQLPANPSRAPNASIPPKSNAPVNDQEESPKTIGGRLPPSRHQPKRSRTTSSKPKVGQRESTLSRLGIGSAAASTRRRQGLASGKRSVSDIGTSSNSSSQRGRDAAAVPKSPTAAGGRLAPMDGLGSIDEDEDAEGDALNLTFPPTGATSTSSHAGNALAAAAPEIADAFGGNATRGVSFVSLSVVPEHGSSPKQAVPSLNMRQMGGTSPRPATVASYARPGHVTPRTTGVLAPAKSALVAAAPPTHYAHNPKPPVHTGGGGVATPRYTPTPRYPGGNAALVRPSTTAVETRSSGKRATTGAPQQIPNHVSELHQNTINNTNINRASIGAAPERSGTRFQADATLLSDDGSVLIERSPFSGKLVLARTADGMQLRLLLTRKLPLCSCVSQQFSTAVSADRVTMDKETPWVLTFSLGGSSRREAGAAADESDVDDNSSTNPNDSGVLVISFDSQRRKDAELLRSELEQMAPTETDTAKGLFSAVGAAFGGEQDFAARHLNNGAFGADVSTGSLLSWAEQSTKGDDGSQLMVGPSGGRDRSGSARDVFEAFDGARPATVANPGTRKTARFQDQVEVVHARSVPVGKMHVGNGLHDDRPQTVHLPRQEHLGVVFEATEDAQAMTQFLVQGNQDKPPRSILKSRGSETGAHAADL